VGLGLAAGRVAKEDALDAAPDGYPLAVYS
jgi:hypothetical protein